MSKTGVQVRWVLSALAAIALALAAIAIIGAFVEPRHQGITASEWVQRLARESTIARPALLEMGYRASPALGKAVLYRPSGWIQSVGRSRIIPSVVRRRFPTVAAAEMIRMRAIEVLYEMQGTNAAPAAAALLRLDTSDDFGAYSYGGFAELTLIRLGTAILPQLRQGLRDGSPAVRERAASLLLRLGPAAEPALPELRLCLQDPALPVRRETLAALAAIGPAAKPALADLRPMLQQGTEERRFEVVESWARIGGEAELILPFLVSCLENPDNPLRARAARALGELGPEARAALPALRKVISTESYTYTQVKAAEAIEKIEPKSATTLSNPP